MLEFNIESFKEDLKWISLDSNLKELSEYRISKFEYEEFISKFNEANLTTLNNSKIILNDYLTKFRIENSPWSKKVDNTLLPALMIEPNGSLKLLVDVDNFGMYKVITKNGTESITELPSGAFFKNLKLQRKKETAKSAYEMFKNIAFSQKRFLVYAVIASISINFLALGSSFYSMQVYDRVIPTNGVSTLISLTVGVFIAIVLEMILKLSRSSIVDQANKNMDVQYSNDIFNTFLKVRADALPKSIGTLSGQLNNYTTVRTFISTFANLFIIDLPFAFMFLGIIILLGGWQIGQVILIFLVLAIAIGLFFKSKITKLTKESTMASHKKLALLVESVENFEKIKSNGGKFSLKSKWNHLAEDAINDEISIKHSTDISTFLATFAQQISYVAVVATGAYIIATTTDITMGSLIAITILSNKVFAPISQLPSFFVLWGRAKISLEDLDNIYKLEKDNNGIERPITHSLNSYDLKCENVVFEYNENSPVLNIPKLEIKEGEKVAILGVIGAGKSTLLKVLSGMYKPKQGRVYIDNLDMQHVSMDNLNDHINYLAQETKLFNGTLRENLSFGIPNANDEAIIEAAKSTGLINLISALPDGLDTVVPEGGSTVSGGQKQLIAMTRMLISKSNVLLLDEPTANMDEGTEKYLLHVLKNNVLPQQTMVIVTHKPILLNLVDRIIILTPNGIAMDDKKEVVLNQLNQNSLRQRKGANE